MMGFGRKGFGNDVISYGGAGDFPDEAEKKLIFVPQPRFTLSYLGIIVSVFCPWILFTGLYAVMISRIHYEYPTFMWTMVLGTGFGLTCITYIIAQRRRQCDEGPSWHSVNTIAFLIATVCAIMFGNMVFLKFADKYYDFLSMNTYTGVNPGKWKGEMVQDAAKVYFTSGTNVNLRKAMSFKQGDTYCVAPISNSPAGENLVTYDFWAVGVNCCHPNPAPSFSCGDIANGRIRSAVRSIDHQEVNAFFRLAVQQAEAAYGINARNPTFFHWTQDPVADIDWYRDEGVKFFLFGTSVFFIFNFVFVAYESFCFATLSGDVKP